MQDDSKLLLGFPCHIIFKPERASVNQRGLFGNTVLAALMSGRKYYFIPKNATIQEKAMRVLRFFKAKPVIKTHLCFRTRYGKASLSGNAVRRWLQHFQETGSVLH